MSTTQSTGPTWDPTTAPGDRYNEAFDASLPQPTRAHYKRLFESLARLSLEEFEDRGEQAADILAEDGANYNVFSEGDAIERPWELDLVPMMASADEWRLLERGLAQRAQVIDAVLRDLYSEPSESRLIREGVLPPEVVYAHPKFLRPFVGLRRADQSPITFYAAELARNHAGDWRIMADRLDAPSGPAYTLENRIVSSRTLPQVIQRLRVQRLAPFFLRWVNAIKALSPRPIENPRVVLLSRGSKSRYYFEDVYLARYLGFDLVQGSDLTVRDGHVFLKTLAGLLQVDVILNRGAEQGIDPLVMGGGAVHGVPGIIDALRFGNVAVTNAPGSGLLESPVFMAFLPQLCRYFYGDDLMLPSIQTLWMGNDADRESVLSRMGDFVIKPAFQASGSREIYTDQLSPNELAALKHDIEREPFNFVAQERAERSLVPCWRQGAAYGRAAIRTFMVRDNGDFHLLPGGFVRTSFDDEPMVLSITGGAASKDLWVQADGPVASVTLLTPPDKPVELQRSNAMFPSRAADDLFWLGISLSRAAVLTRLNRVVVDRLLADSQHDEDEMRALVSTLTAAGQAPAEFAQLTPSLAIVELGDQLTALLFEQSNSRGVAATVAEMLRLGSLTRDLISVDTWRKIRQTADTYFGAKRHVDDLGEAQTALVQLGADLASISGMIHDGMIRGPAWLFLDLGRCIVNARSACKFLLQLAKQDALKHEGVLKAVLEVFDSRMTYRFRYMDNLQQNATLDLAITDVTNPNSIAFQLHALQNHARSLPSNQNDPLPSEEQQQTGSAIQALQSVTQEALAARDLEEVRQALHVISTSITGLADTLTRNYLVHSGPPRQITSEPS